MAPYLASVNPNSDARTVLSMHNIESLRFRRELPTTPWGARRLALPTDRVLFGSWEEKAIRQFDGIVTRIDVGRGMGPHIRDWRRDCARSERGEHRLFLASASALLSADDHFHGIDELPA